MENNKSIYDIPQNFINRELSWLEFNSRVLEEVQDLENPLFERLKFNAIVSSNLDEFFMIRVASLWELVDVGINNKDFSGLTPRQTLKKISIRVHELVNNQYKIFNSDIKQCLETENIFFLKEKDLNENQRRFVNNYYVNYVYPVLTPMVVDERMPFPLILNKSLNIALLLKSKKDKAETLFGTIQVPAVLDRFIKIPCEDGRNCFMLLEDIIKMYLEDLFSGHIIFKTSCYRITRNADLDIDEEEVEDLLLSIEESINQRKWGTAVRLEIENGTDEVLLSILEEELNISRDDEYEINGPLDLTYLMNLSSLRGFDSLRFDQIKPQVPVELMENDNIFEAISKKDILLHHPYNSFKPIIELVQRAAVDPDLDDYIFV